MLNVDTALQGFSENGTALGELDKMLYQYCEGVYANMATARQNKGALDPVLQNVLASVTATVPGAAQAKAIAGVAYNELEKLVGVGSTLGMVGTALFKGNVISGPINAIKAVFNGRTYRYDQYQLAVAFSFHVLGKDIGDSNHASDDLVIAACKWFIDRLGVFINGATTLYALVDGLTPHGNGSVLKYTQLVNQNPFITTDLTRVQAALNVVHMYMPDDNSTPGNWSQTIGVYDKELVSLANQGYSNYQQNLNTIKQTIASGNDNILTGTMPIQLKPQYILYIVVGILLIILLIKL